jgi:hypothetical protein
MVCLFSLPVPVASAKAEPAVLAAASLRLAHARINEQRACQDVSGPIGRIAGKNRPLLGGAGA